MQEGQHESLASEKAQFPEALFPVPELKLQLIGRNFAACSYAIIIDKSSLEYPVMIWFCEMKPLIGDIIIRTMN